MKNRLFPIVLSNILLAFVLVGSVAFAQDNPAAVDASGSGAESLLTNSISGLVVDGSGNGVAGVTVTATRVKYPVLKLRKKTYSQHECILLNRWPGCYRGGIGV